MSNKTKIQNKNTTTVKNIYKNLGLLLMTSATALGLVELHNHSKNQAVVNTRPVFAFQEESNNNLNSLRTERNETVPHYISYSETQRTPSRSSKY
ncbi:MAG TPA: hypothetical protein VLF63_03230 [Patescibacteria group bacterium]|nr:hypothetical protein [Patescibacteria group bacterium]